MPPATPPLLLALAAVTLSLPALAQDRPQVVATTGMVADTAAVLAGECAEVTAMMGPGIDPHLYRPTPRDVQALNGADLIVYSGLSLEGQLADVLERYASQIPTLAVAEAAIPPEDLIATGDSYGVDPHVWMDVSLWSRTIAPMAEALAERAPDCAEAIAGRAASHAERLSDLDAWVGEAIATIPEDRRILVTAHDAFGYYARAYGIAVEAVQGISTDAEAGIADIRDTAQLLVDTATPAVFVESTINPRTIEAVIAAAAAQGHAVSVGDPLYSDALGEPGTPAGTYVGMIVENTTNIVVALGGAIPPLPERLR
ncbi:metal ABC transporter solute-binding protein, Zn/Mn family [Pelagibacterium montanilacus]|uniref:metal ABC transporter solute-binding protein, Zn/Mn family n=1 Tax=Pelagibacterium montanilacus TaxID=2185280 RepID=UPI000F8D7C3F|nr:zinc ABC transporter substrate-binding protein [Pelagibacterium montanilacus]